MCQCTTLYHLFSDCVKKQLAVGEAFLWISLDVYVESGFILIQFSFIPMLKILFQIPGTSGIWPYRGCGTVASLLS